MVNKYKNIPDDMKSLKRFIGWEKENLNGKVSKLPFSLIDGEKLNWNIEDRWLIYKDIENQNLGFVLNDDNIFCIDLDNAIVNGKLTNMAKEIINEFEGTYMEISQSNTGIHIFAKGRLINNLIKPNKGLEIYKNNRYIALTGNVGDGKYFPISNKLLDKEEQVNSIYKKWTQEELSIKTKIEYYKKQEERLGNIPLSTGEILTTMERTNSKANILINGGSITGDPSRDDFIFLCLARNYTDGQRNLMRELFLMTPLNRMGDSSKRQTNIKYLEYLDGSISKVLSLGRYIPFDWSNHLSYKRRLESYERD